MKVKEWEIDKIKPYENNPRQNEDAVDKVAASIKEFGWQQPIVVDRDGVIIVGHTRWKAAKQLGLTTAPVTVAEDLTEEQARAYRLADNKTAEFSGWDFEALDSELFQIENIEMAAFGFETEEEEAEVIDDEYTEKDDVPKIAKPGAIYRLGDHRLLVGDATNAAAIRELCEEDVDLLITDPPYNVALGRMDRPSTARELHRRTDGLVIENDSMPEDEFIIFLRGAFEAANGCMKPGAAYYIWHASNHTAAFETAAELAKMPMREVLIWVKSNFAMGRQDYQWAHEPCIYGWKTGAAHYFVDDRTQSTVFEDARPDFNKMKKDEMRQLLEDIYSDKVSTTVIHEKKPGRSELHPTMKPVPLIGRLMKNSSKKGGVVLDPFGGSGTTMIAAEQLGRRCYMAEIDTHYADVIIDRWQTFTGGKAEEING